MVKARYHALTCPNIEHGADDGDWPEFKMAAGNRSRITSERERDDDAISALPHIFDHDRHRYATGRHIARPWAGRKWRHTIGSRNNFERKEMADAISAANSHFRAIARLRYALNELARRQPYMGKQNGDDQTGVKIFLNGKRWAVISGG